MHRGDPALIEESLGDASPAAAAEETAAAEVAAKDYPDALASAAWIVRVASPDETPERTMHRWRHIGLEVLLDRRPEARPIFAEWIDHKLPIVAVNAAIALARLGKGDPGSALAAGVRNRELPLPVRRAAAEALGQLDAEAVAPLIDELLAELGDFGPAARRRYSAELHEELLRALVAAEAKSAAEQLRTAFESSSAAVRLVALQLWPLDTNPKVDDRVWELTQDAQPPVRAQAITLLAKTRHPQASAAAQQALTDQSHDVRLAAIAALGELGGAASRQALKTQLHSQPEKTRVAVVSALAAMGEKELVAGAGRDASWRVRQAVAVSLGNSTDQQAKELAQTLLGDRSSGVATAVVESLARWPAAQSGPVLLKAMDSPSFALRQAAANVLSQQWEPAGGFSPQAAQEQRRKQLTALTARFENEFPTRGKLEPDNGIGQPETASVPKPVDSATLAGVARAVTTLADPTRSAVDRQQASRQLLEQPETLIAALAAIESQQQAALPASVFRELLPQVSREFALLAEFETTDVGQRRKAAGELSQLARNEQLSRLALSRLANLAAGEEDLQVWRSLQQSLAEDPREGAVRLQTAALSHPSAEVRRAACQHLGRHGGAEHSGLLVPSLSDADPQVVLAAVEALGKTGRIENPLPLVRLLASRDKSLVVQVAGTLASMDYQAGNDALERLTYDRDAGIRRQAVAAMGAAKSRRFVPTLIRMLGDQLGIRRAALTSLAQIVGDDIGTAQDASPPTMSEQVRRWQAWHSRQNSRRLR